MSPTGSPGVRISIGVCFHGDSRSHRAEVIKSHSQTWNRPTRLHYCDLTSVRELNNWLLAKGKLMMAFQQICPGSWFRSGNKPFLKIELESERQSKRQSKLFYLYIITGKYLECGLSLLHFSIFSLISVSFSNVSVLLKTANHLEMFLFPPFPDPESQSLTLFYLRHLLGIKLSTCWSETQYTLFINLQ